MAEGSEQACNSKEEEMEEVSEEDEEFLPGYQTIQDYSKALLSEVVKATKAANALPQEGDDYDYYSSFPGFRTFCSKMGSRITRSISRLIRHESLPCYWPPPSLAPPSSEKAGLVTTTTEELDERMEAIVEANDILLERVGVLMDEACGLRKKDEAIVPTQLQEGTAEVASWNKQDSSEGRGVASYNIMASRNVPRPQVRFKDQIDNSNTVFVPRIRNKPNARQPLPDVYHRLQNPQSLNALIANSKEWAVFKLDYKHPYQFELEHFVPTDAQIKLSEPQAPGSLEEVPYLFITKEEELDQLVTELSKCTEFAIDLENHSYRSFQGFVCLMQITTRNHDYIIDTLELRHLMYRLLDPFTDPHIVKVMHGADWDIPWLQRDFGLYIVNLFDTGQASRVLKLPKYSLAFLLQYCCDVVADKQYQLADWRIRPLPPQMERYAREDTHYLLYIYDRMKNELIRRMTGGKNLLQMTLDLSRDICLRIYEKKIFKEDAYLKLYYKHKRNFSSQQLRCLQLLYEWRDCVARDEDESQGYVLPNHMLFQISEQLPREAQGVLACCTPIPTLVRQQLQEVFMLVQEAKQTQITKQLPELELNTTVSGPHSIHPVIDTSPNTPTHSHTTLTKPLIVPDYQRHHHYIETEGPPVKSAPTSLSAIEWVCPELSDTVKKQLLQIKASFPDVLAQFMEVRSGVVVTETADDVTEEATPRLASPTVTMLVEPPPSVDSSSASERVTTNRRDNRVSKKHPSIRELVKSKKKKQRIVREVSEEGELCEEEEDDGRQVKKIKFDEDDFIQFNYQGASFTDFTQEPSHPPAVHLFQPPTKRSKDGGGSAPRSKVHHRSGERSHTYTGNNKQHSNSKRLWPRKV